MVTPLVVTPRSSTNRARTIGPGSQTEEQIFACRDDLYSWAGRDGERFGEDYDGMVADREFQSILDEYGLKLVSDVYMSLTQHIMETRHVISVRQPGVSLVDYRTTRASGSVNNRYFVHGVSLGPIPAGTPLAPLSAPHIIMSLPE